MFKSQDNTKGFVAHRLVLCISLAAVTAACTVQDPASLSAAIASQFEQSKGTTINLATAVPGAWERVCILGPYSDNASARKTLGFAWDAEGKTAIQTNDSISLLLFVHENDVQVHVEHSRKQGDFSNLSGQCFARQKAQFTHQRKPLKGWPGLFQS